MLLGFNNSDNDFTNFTINFISYTCQHWKKISIIEEYQDLNGFFSKLMNEVYRKITCNLQKFNPFKTAFQRTNRFGLDSISNCVSQLRSTLANATKFSNLWFFKTKKIWTSDNCQFNKCILNVNTELVQVQLY